MKHQWNLVLPLAVLGAMRTLMHVFVAIAWLEALVWLIIAAVWITTVLIRKVPRPFLVLLVVGGVYGVLAAIIQQIFWIEYWQYHEASAFSFELATDEVRPVAFMSSIAMGLIWGAIIGLAAHGFRHIRKLGKIGRRRL